MKALVSLFFLLIVKESYAGDVKKFRLFCINEDQTNDFYFPYDDNDKFIYVDGIQMMVKLKNTVDIKHIVIVKREVYNKIDKVCDKNYKIKPIMESYDHKLNFAKIENGKLLIKLNKDINEESNIPKEMEHVFIHFG
ncbi:hypothetical protein [Fluviispira vulneris]|uniref:hypothetical protein n=1 Tax=Fluviispira vulneris TaxID=2763012 RepID=UPI001646981B|nr:hypothetical protein [Fluviispira vulneris]